MTSLLHPLAAVVMMGGVPLTFDVGPGFMARTHAPAMIYAAQSAQVEAAPAVVRDAEAELLAEPVRQDAGPQTTIDPPAAAVDTDDAEAAPQPETPASTPTPAGLSDADRQDILRKAASALAAAETAKGRFTQVSPDGSVTHGDFALRRPGRMRFDYDAPTPILIVSDGTTVAMEDSDLETVDRVPLASTPLGLILDDELDFQNEARVTDVRRGSDEVMVTVEDRSGESEGQLSLFFDRATYELKSWRALDANRQTTLVVLEDVQTNVGVDPRLFILEDPADEEEDER